MMARPKKRTLALRALNAHKKLKTIASASEPALESESESEIEEQPITFPDLPELEEKDCEDSDAFKVLNNSTRDVRWKDAYIRNQRTTQPCRTTLWRQQQRKDALQAAAYGSYDIRSMFTNHTSLAIPRIETSLPRNVVVATAITKLEKLLGYNRASRKFESSMNGQTTERHRAVLHFLYMQRKNPTTTRRELSLQVAQSFNRGKYFAGSVVAWERMWIRGEGIPEGKRGCHTKLSSLFNDEEVQLFVREFVSTKKEEVTASLLAQAVTEFVGSRMGTNVKASLEAADAETEYGEQQPRSLKARAAGNWLRCMGYSWRRAKKGVYVDGHERDDVVKYRQEVFLPKLQQVRNRLARWNEDGSVFKEGALPEGDRWVVIVTHDESTFNVNDGRRQMWLKDDENPLLPKGNGKGIMISEFLTPRSRLHASTSVSNNQLEDLKLPRFATEMFEYGKDKYWNSELLAKQTLDVAVPLFEVAFPPDRFQGLFLFDNATSHNVVASDALDVRRMNLGPGGKNTPKMRDGWNPATNSPQQMNDANGVPKGIRTILQERNLWPSKGIRLDCTKKTRETDGSCCARHLLGSQPDFQAQQGLLQEEIQKRTPGCILSQVPPRTKFH